MIRQLPGVHDAPARWEALYTEVIESCGCARGRADACCFYLKERGLRCVVHGDDFTLAGWGEDLDWAQQKMRWPSSARREAAWEAEPRL